MTAKTRKTRHDGDGNGGESEWFARLPEIVQMELDARRHGNHIGVAVGPADDGPVSPEEEAEYKFMIHLFTRVIRMLADTQEQGGDDALSAEIAQMRRGRLADRLND